jgi:hypothetical protein
VRLIDRVTHGTETKGGRMFIGRQPSFTPHCLYRILASGHSFSAAAL